MDPIKKYRYPGINYFEITDSDIFYGRKDDRKKLSDLVEIERTVLLYSRSGLGKSSLINAALIPELIKRNYQPFYIRLRRYDETNQSPVENILRQTVLLNKKSLPVTFLQKFINRNYSLWYAFKSFQIQSSTDKPICLIFDQFEEIVDYPNSDLLDFKKQLSELLYTEVPRQYLDALKSDYLLIESLTEDELDLLYKPMRAGVVFAIRSDQLSLLSRFSDYFPNILKVNYELKPLTRDQALDAIKEPASKEKEDKFFGEKFTYNEKAFDKILDTLDEKSRNEIDTAQLQIILQHIERNIVGKKVDHIVTTGELGDLNAVYENYYANCLASLPSQKKEAQILIEDKLIVNGTRISYDMKLCLQDVTKDTLDALVETRLLRQEPNTTGGFSYEIAHDTLIDAILKSQEKRKEKLNLLYEAESLIKQSESLKLKEDFEGAINMLEEAKKIYDEYPEEIQKSVNARLAIAKSFLDWGEESKFYNSKEQLIYIQNMLVDDKIILDEDDKKRNTGHVNESYGMLYTKWRTGKKKDHDSIELDKTLRDFTASDQSHQINTDPEQFFRDALKNYEEVKKKKVEDNLNAARIAEHIAVIIEAKFVDTLITDNIIDEQMLNESLAYYDRSLALYKKLYDLIGQKRIENTKQRFENFYPKIETKESTSRIWGYVTEIFTGKTYFLKGKKSVRIGRDVYNEETKTYAIKNEVGFPSSYRLMSRRHMVIHPDLSIEDTQSLNGTTINTFPLYYGSPRKLTDKDIIVLANIMPLQFSQQEPQPVEVPGQCWGIIIDGAAKKYYYLEGLDKIFSVSLVRHKSGYDLKFSDFEEDDALMKFKYSDEEPYFFAEEKIEVTTNINNEGVVEDIMATWKIRTTVKDTDRFYKDYILNTGKWFGAFDFPMQPQLNFIEKKKVKKTDEQGKETEEEVEEEKIYAYGPAFQLILKPEYNPQLRQYFEER